MAKKKVKKKKAKRTSSGSSLDTFLANGEPLRGFSNLPSNTYEGHIKAGSAILEQKDGGGERVTMYLVVDEGEFEGREQRKRDDLTTDFGVNLFLGDLVAMEFEPPTTKKELAECLAATDDVKVRFWVSQPKDEFPPKVRINELLEGDSNGPAASSEADDNVWTEKIIRDMNEDDMEAAAKDEGLDPDDYDTYEALADELVVLLV